MTQAELQERLTEIAILLEGGMITQEEAAFERQCLKDEINQIADKAETAEQHAHIASLGDLLDVEPGFDAGEWNNQEAERIAELEREANSQFGVGA